jgi:hypothetical protein
MGNSEMSYWIERYLPLWKKLGLDRAMEKGI